jgi:hypothetical protein
MTDSKGVRASTFKRYGYYAWVTLGFILISLVGHWLFAWFAYVDEQTAHGQAIEAAGYFNQVMRDTLENWQSEFLQLLWQVGGLVFLLYIGSPQLKKGNDRMEAKLDEVLRRLDPIDADRLIREIDDRYSGRETDIPHGHR